MLIASDHAIPLSSWLATRL